MRKSLFSVEKSVESCRVLSNLIMKFSSNVAILGLIFILFANEFISVHSAGHSQKKKPPIPKPTKMKPTTMKPTTSTKKEESSTEENKFTDILESISDTENESSDQVPENVGMSGESGFSTALGVGLQVAEVVSSFAPSPIGNLLSFGLGLFGSAYKKPQKSSEMKAIESMAKESEKRDLKTQSMISEQGEQIYEMDENSKDRDALTQEMLDNQMIMLENMDEASRDRDLKTHEMLEEQKEMLINMKEASEERNFNLNMMIIKKAEKLETLLQFKSEDIVVDAVDMIERNDLFKRMNKDITFLRKHYALNLKCILSSCVDTANKLNQIIFTASEFRVKLDNFVGNYIMNTDSSSSQKLYYEFLLDDNGKKIREYKDCHSRSLQTYVLESYMSIILTLTNSYSLVGTAFASEYDNRVEGNNNTKIVKIKNNPEQAINKFMEQLEILMRKTKSTLNSVSGEIRKCGPTIPGEEYGSLEFLKTGLFAYGNSFLLRRDQANIYSPLMWEYLKGRGLNIPLNYIDYSKFNCQITNWKTIEYYLDPDEPIPGYHHIYDGSETYGKMDDISDLERYDITGDIKQCYIYKTTKKVGFSTQTVDAQPGHVITGIRWRITDNIVYIDIKEAKFIDGLRVDISTEEWYETPESDELVQPFTQDLRGILLADVKLNTGFYVTGVKMISIDGKLTLSVRGSGTNDQGTKLFGQQSYVQPKKMKRSEWKINEADDPDFGEAKNVSKKVQRDQTKYYVNLQPTDFKKDLGRKTIPYFDIQEIITYPPAPIGGLGIYYKVVEGYGGFVALKMFTPDYNNMINEKKLQIYKQLFQLNSSKIGQLNSTKTGPLNGKKTG